MENIFVYQKSVLNMLLSILHIYQKAYFLKICLNFADLY